MSGIECYNCNKKLTDEETHHWRPFGLCDECKVEIAIDKAIEQSRKEELRLYWQLPPHWQQQLRLLFLRGKLS